MSRDRSSIHIDTVMIEAYAAQLLDAGAEASIEWHLSCCGECRAGVAAASARGDLAGLGPDRLGTIWASVIDTIEAPPVAVPRKKRRSQWTVGEFIRPLLTSLAIPARRLAPWVRGVVVVTTVAVMTLPSLINICASAPLPTGDNVDSVAINSGPQGHAQSALHNVSQRPPCSRTEVLFTLTRGLSWWTWVVLTAGDGSPSGQLPDADQQHLQHVALVIECLIADADAPTVPTSTTDRVAQRQQQPPADPAHVKGMVAASG